jgi:cytoskeletal protein RodZ
MRSSLALLAIALLGLSITACGGASSAPQTSSDATTPGSRTSTVSSATSTASTSTSTSAGSTQRSTESHLKDSNDGDDDPASDDDNEILDYGHAASAADKRAITAMVTSYYAAAAADDGIKACSLIYSLVAESIPEENNQTSGVQTCASVMSKLFMQHQGQMTTDNASLKVTRVRVEGSKGLALLDFGKTPEPHVLVHSEHSGAWKMESLLETGMP